MNAFRALTLIGLVLLSACATTPPKRINPPQISIQRLGAGADGSITVDLRIENQSDLSMHFVDVDLALRVADIDAGRIQLNPDLEIAAHSAELITRSWPAPDALAPLFAAERSEVKPPLEGEFEYENRNGEMVKVPIDAARAAEIKSDLARNAQTAVFYTLRGSVRSSEPEREYDIQVDSRLSPVPGMPGEFR